MDYEILFPGRFIKSVDLKGRDVTLVIASVKAEEIEDKPKAILTFEGTKKAMVMNRTNAEAIKLMFGRETEQWLGKRITIFPAAMKDPFGDGEITAIRVRGSPDITEAKSATIQRGRKTLKVSVRPTGKGAAPASNGKGATAPAAASAPASPAPAAGQEPPDDLPLPTLNGPPAVAAPAAAEDEVPL